jgi:hypothetical protein
MATQSRWMHLTTALAASLGLATLAVISSASHEQDEPGVMKEPRFALKLDFPETPVFGALLGDG